MPELELRFRDARVWRYAISSIEKIIDEGVFVANENGLQLRALDTSHVAMVDFNFPRESFDKYEIGSEEVAFSVSFKEFLRVLRRALKEDELVLRVEGNFIYVIFESLQRGRRTFRLPQIYLTVERLGEPKIEFTVKAKMLGTTFRDSIKDLEVAGDVLKIQASDSEDRLLLTSIGDIESAEVELSLENQTLLELDVKEPEVSTSYSLEYFSEMLSAAQVADSVTLLYANYAPARVDIEYGAGGRLTFYVSPREE
ncbi:MAG: proliferating cell nuclear antigen (pcna) [Desulfurococcales archaeon]|nr:proliferating cell nuclear antigen (pcna) [Desulfurococcales archaeon]